MLLVACAGLVPAQARRVSSKRTAETASYRVTLVSVSPLKLAVAATLQLDGQSLDMATSRPGDVPPVGDHGWPALVQNLKVTDASGHALSFAPPDASGWKLTRPYHGRVTLTYAVDYAPFAERSWPAPRESVFADADNVVLAGRAVFITAPGPSTVTFTVPRGWLAATPWASHGNQSFAVATAEDLTENLFVLTRTKPEVMTARSFRLRVAATRRWQPVRPQIRSELEKVIAYYVDLMGFGERGDYLVVLLPQSEHGGESFRSSFALNVEGAPTTANRITWGTTIAHEIFHYWNGWRLQGADYGSSQWFQEGFTQYAATLAMLHAGLMTPDQFRAELARHIANYARLEKPLGAKVTSKGPPLYSGGFLAAFTWDVKLRGATAGKQNLGDFLRALWRQTNNGRKPYADSDLLSALDRVAPADWEAFFRDHIHGSARLPMADVLRLAALRTAPDGQVELDPNASPEARKTWAALATPNRK